MDKVFELRSKPQTTTPANQPFFGGAPSQQSFFPGADPVIQRQPAPGAESKSTDTAKDPQAVVGTNSESESELRKQLEQLFHDFEKQIVGDEKFDAIIEEDKWNDIKADEETAKAEYKKKKDKYDEDMKAWDKKSPKPIPPIPVPVYTTCIDTQRILLQKALAAAGLHIKKVSSYNNQGKVKKDSKKTTSYAFATLGQQQAKELNAWHEATTNMDKGNRPKKGDIIILAKRGSKADKAAQELEYNKKYAPAETEKKSQANDKAQDALEAADAANTEAQAALESLVEAKTSPTDASLIKAKGKVISAAAAFKAAKKKADEAAAALKKSQDVIPQSMKKLDDARKSADHSKFFEFSHVGFFISKEDNKNGTETWITFDGGQTVQSRGAKQGSESNRRIYDPVNNEISGEKSQGGEARWLQGWVDVDKLAEESDTK